MDLYTALAIFSYIGMLFYFFGTFYTVVKDNKKAMYTTMLGATVNILLCFLLIPQIGITGALIANVASYAVIVGMRIRDSKRYVSLTIDRVVAIDIVLIFCQSIVLSVPFNGHLFIAATIPFLLGLIHWNDFKGTLSF